MKLIKLHWRIFYWTITGKIHSLSSKFLLQRQNNKKQNVLLIFPIDEPSFRVALYAFRNLGVNGKDKKNYIFIVKEQFKDIFPIQYGRIILVHDINPMDMVYEEGKILDQLKNVYYDIVVDLNSNFYLGIARLISKLRAELKIGFKSRFSSKFYNIQLDISKNNIMEKGYKQIISLLKS